MTEIPRRAVVPHVGDAQKARYNGDTLPGAERGLHDRLQALIQDEDRKREP